MPVDSYGNMRAPKGTGFEITDDHLKLLQRMWVQWQWDEYGAPEVDPKRPYGNSSVAMDICEILGWDFDDDEGPTELQEGYARKIHEEMLWVIQIIFQLQSVAIGKYIQVEEYGYEWRKMP